MQASVHRPSLPAVRAYLTSLRTLPLTYWERKATQWERMPQGYAHDEVRASIGHGREDFEAACAAIRTWAMFPSDWTISQPARQRGGLPRVGDQTLVSAKLLGLWWHNPARVVYTVDEPTRYGFAYGTLPGHLEQGEELFAVEIDDDGTVYYCLRAMSRPHWWAAKLARPYARSMQANFRRDSLAAMRAFVARERTQRPVLAQARVPRKVRALAEV